jgi:hypothetical protein
MKAALQEIPVNLGAYVAAILPFVGIRLGTDTDWYALRDALLEASQGFLVQPEPSECSSFVGFLGIGEHALRRFCPQAQVAQYRLELRLWADGVNGPAKPIELHLCLSPVSGELRSAVFRVWPVNGPADAPPYRRVVLGDLGSGI